MKALRFQKTGDLSNLKLEELPTPTLKANEVLIQVKAAGINPSDVKNVQGLMAGTTVPRIPGRDFSGIIVKGKHVGQAVFGTGGLLGVTRDGSHAEFLVVPEDAVVPMPENLTFEVAAAIGVPWITAWTAVIGLGKIKSKQDILITGITGAVGKAAAQIAKRKGARVIGTVRKESDKINNSYVDVIINLESQDLATVVKETTQGKGVPLIVDTVGGPLFPSCIKCLAVGGTQVALASIEPEVRFNLIDFYRREAHLVGLDTLKLTIQECAAILRRLLPILNKGDVEFPIERCAIDHASEVYQKIKDGQAKSKYIIWFA